MANRFTIKNSKVVGGEGSTFIRITGPGGENVFDIDNTEIGTTTGIDIVDGFSPRDLQVLARLVRKYDVNQSEFTEMIDSVRSAGVSDREQVAESSWIVQKLSLMADVTGLAQFVVAIAASDKFHQVIHALFS